MKKRSVLILFVFASILISCAPQVTVTSEVTVTLPPPTATQTPEPSATPTAVYTPTPTQETIKNSSGIEFVLGSPIDGQDGAFVVTSIVGGKDWMSGLDVDTRLGFAPDDNQWVAIRNTDGTTKVVLQRVSDNTQIAELKPSGTVKWDWNLLVDSDGKSIFFKGAKVLEKANLLSSTNTSAQLRMLNDVADNLPGDRSTFSATERIILSRDGLQVILIDFVQRGENVNAGYVCMIGNDKKTIVFWTENFDLSLPPVTR